MRMKMCKQMLAITVCFLLFSGTMSVQAEETIKHSTVDYDASFRNATQIYIGNERTVDWKVGDKYFLHYTVTDVTEDNTNQSGMLVTKDQSLDFPYLEGGMHYGTDVSLCEEGWTYLFRFEVTENGLKYVAGKAKGTESSYIQFPYAAGELKTKAPYFGVWITGINGESLTAEFSHMRCYDEQGNDLGVYAPKAKQIRISDMNALEVNHSYSFSVTEVACLAFGSARYTESDVIMLEYTVNNVKAVNVTQSGAEFTNAPTAYFPHADNMGYLNYDFHNQGDEPTKLLTEGASYLVRFERGKDKFDVLVRRTMPNGAVDYFSFANYHGTYDGKFGYVVMWIGQECSVTADFTNVKCYDNKGNNLAIQTNKDVEVIHYGDLEDYTQCIAVYYCKENATFISLNDECNASRRLIGEESEVQGTYSIGQGTLKLKIGEDSEEFEYAYEHFRDVDGNKYVRLRDRKVTFMSQSVNGEVLGTATVSAATGYKIEKPNDPTGEKGNFLGWVDGAGKEYDFDTIVTDATTLYAIWDGEQEWEVLQLFTENGWNMGVIVTGIVCVLLIGGTVTASLIFVRKRRVYEHED